jgi:hypothetical protein
MSSQGQRYRPRLGAASAAGFSDSEAVKISFGWPSAAGSSSIVFCLTSAGLRGEEPWLELALAS